jgi:hypothetical protein
VDYKIKLEYSGIGKEAAAARRKVIQAQKVAEKKGVTPKAGIDTNKQLISSTQKLINSNQSLEKALKTPGAKRPAPSERIGIPRVKPDIKKAVPFQKAAEKKEIPQAEGLSRGNRLITALQELTLSVKNLNKNMRVPPGGGGPGIGAAATGRAAGTMAGMAARGPNIGGIGASLPIVGAGIAALGFTIQKINQIGNAYIELSGQQLRSVGMGGFRRGQGIFGATEMGAGMAGFARGTGEFAANVDPMEARIRDPLAIATRYGLPAEQTLRQAGVFRRAGGRIERAAGEAAAGGRIQADMPVLLTGMSSILEDAMRSAIDTSEMHLVLLEVFKE